MHKTEGIAEADITSRDMVANSYRPKLQVRETIDQQEEGDGSNERIRPAADSILQEGFGVI